MVKYTDKQNILIAKEVYKEYDVNYEVYIDDKNTDNKITVIENEVLNRADEFTKNKSLEYIQNEILKASMYISKPPLLGQDFSNPSIHDFSTVIFTIPTMDELWRYIKRSILYRMIRIPLI